MRQWQPAILSRIWYKQAKATTVTGCWTCPISFEGCSKYIPSSSPESLTSSPTAVWLLDPDHYRAYFTDQFHPAYDSLMAQAWTTFLYCYCGWTDFPPTPG